MKEWTFHWHDISEEPPIGTKAIVQDVEDNMMIGTFTEWGWTFPCYVAKSVAWTEQPPKYEANNNKKKGI